MYFHTPFHSHFFSPCFHCQGSSEGEWEGRGERGRGRGGGWEGRNKNRWPGFFVNLRAPNTPFCSTRKEAINVFHCSGVGEFCSQPGEICEGSARIIIVVGILHQGVRRAYCYCVDGLRVNTRRQHALSCLTVDLYTFKRTKKQQQQNKTKANKQTNKNTSLTHVLLVELASGRSYYFRL